jgi:hypothetical protein
MAIGTSGWTLLAILTVVAIAVRRHPRARRQRVGGSVERARHLQRNDHGHDLHE